MALLVVNAGSSSVKFRLYALEREKLDLKQVLAEGLVERIGAPDARFHFKSPAFQTVLTQDIPDHEAALSTILRLLLSRDTGVLQTRADIRIIGHRIVHGGDRFVSPVLIDKDVKGEISKCARFAPLHNPVNLAGVLACERLFPSALNVAVFDTAFHSTLPPEAFHYALPHILYEKHGIRRYGFHGTSHRFVSDQARKFLSGLQRPSDRIVVCHLGNGASVCAVNQGRSVDTSMGFTPLEGLMMGTRSGDVDPGILLNLLKLAGLTSEELDRIINQYSGLKGVTEDTSDMRTVIEKAENGYGRHQLALTMYCYRVRKYIGSYAAVLGGLDAIVFTGGVGENSAVVRDLVCQNLGFLGVVLDGKLPEKPQTGVRLISESQAPVAVLVVPTDEEAAIASQSLDVVSEVLKVENDSRKRLETLTAEERLLLVRTWNEVGGNPEETIATYAVRAGVSLTHEQLVSEMASLGVRF